MSHHHHHGHGHHHHGHGAHAHDGPDPHDDHAHAGVATLTAFRWSTGLNLILVAAEAAVGLTIGSMSLVADAGHNLSDVLGLVLAWAATRIATRRPTQKHTYGMARSTILASLTNAVLLLVACGALAWESVHRFGEVHHVEGKWVTITALVGVLVNAGSAALFWRGQKHDVNARGAFLHMAADAAISLAVVVTGIIISYTGLDWLDPAMGLVIAAFIVVSSWGLLRESLDLALDAVPRGLDLDQIRAALETIDSVKAVHDLHVWPLSTTVAALTAHLEHEGRRDTDELLTECQVMIAERFRIKHTTLQFENVGCSQRC